MNIFPPRVPIRGSRAHLHTGLPASPASEPLEEKLSKELNSATQHLYGLVAFATFRKVKKIQLLAEAAELGRGPSHGLGIIILVAIKEEADEIWKSRKALVGEEEKARMGLLKTTPQHLVALWDRMFDRHVEAEVFLEGKLIQKLTGHSVNDSEAEFTTLEAKEYLTALPDHIQTRTVQVFRARLSEIYFDVKDALRNAKEGSKREVALNKVLPTANQFYNLLPSDLPVSLNHFVESYMKVQAYICEQYCEKTLKNAGIHLEEMKKDGYRSDSLGHRVAQRTFRPDISERKARAVYGIDAEHWKDGFKMIR